MNTLKAALVGGVMLLSACSYPSEQACLEHHAACHIGALDGDWHAGAGIPVDSMAGAALMMGVMQSMQPAPSYNVYVHGY